MLNRFKAALYNVVGNFDPTEGGTVGTLGTVSLSSGVQNIPSVIRQNSSQGKEKTVKFPYTRPHFLQLNSEDEILVTADHALRPIICPRDISRLPWNAGYAETINAGKSKRNEDQAAVHVGLLTRTVKRPVLNRNSSNYSRSYSKESKKGSSINGIIQTKDHSKPIPAEEACPSSLNGVESSARFHQNGVDELMDSIKIDFKKDDDSLHSISLPYYYFGVFDGHAGWGAAVSAANQLHHIIHEKLCDVIELIIPDECDESILCGPLWSSEKTVTPESAITGALEQAFWTMDQQIGEDRQKHYLNGGCTACVALFILGKVFVSNAGDSRGVIGFYSNPVPMSFDFTPETETQRIRKLGARHPELLGGEFTHLEFLRRPLRSDVGKKAPFRDHYMTGWGLKTITEADLKYPLVCGEGKRSRVLATIGVTRGFGDHDLKAQFSSLPIKPFLSPEPEVRVFDLREQHVTDEDFLILGTDGLWDIMSNDKAVHIVCNALQQFSPEDSHRFKYRYTSAAHDLVLWSRGRFREHQWRTLDDKHATIDDISAFVIPLKMYELEFQQWKRGSQRIEMPIDPSEEVIVPTASTDVLAKLLVSEAREPLPVTRVNFSVTTKSSTITDPVIPGVSEPSDSLSPECLESFSQTDGVNRENVNSSSGFTIPDVGGSSENLPQTQECDSTSSNANNNSLPNSNSDETLLHRIENASISTGIIDPAICTIAANDTTINSNNSFNSNQLDSSNTLTHNNEEDS